MPHRFDSSLLVRLGQTLLFSLGGFLLMSLFAQHSTLSYREFVIGAVSLTLMWLGTTARLGRA